MASHVDGAGSLHHNPDPNAPLNAAASDGQGRSLKSVLIAMAFCALIALTIVQQVQLAQFRSDLEEFQHTAAQLQSTVDDNSHDIDSLSDRTNVLELTLKH